ncbi:MAG: LacI family DNA-binding transcriptional regulator, partial [Erysipelotrichaceae bacterium]|nr:LacI family DNA-binding transcriptional regulator [Erysipelotrichaceae bacterium]
MTKKKITINDVAEAAGVSKATVSRYLNGRTDLMTEKTRDRIAHVIDLLNYHPSELARSLKSKKTRTIGVILTDIRSPFYSAVLSGIDEKLSEYGYSAIYVNSSDDPEKELANLQNLLSKDVDGILINTVSYRNEALISETANRIPMVLIDREIENHSFSVVRIDNKKMVSLLFDHLEEEG